MVSIKSYIVDFATIYRRWEMTFEGYDENSVFEFIHSFAEQTAKERKFKLYYSIREHSGTYVTNDYTHSFDSSIVRVKPIVIDNKKRSIS